ncbi:MAG: extracellular solute-binding protein [Coprothermobacterota bacterium]|jgi:putative spermidine/putrescine transport system substrate-binding protein|nr:extracellular solute-binding protein [Coprothermobacterota bacterium]
MHPVGQADLKKPDALTVMTWPLNSLWGKALKECVSDLFTFSTGIPVRHVEHTGVDTPPELLRACEKGKRPPCDVLYCNTVPAIRMARSGFTDCLSCEEFPVLGKLSRRSQPVAEGLSGWPFVIAYDVRYVMMYREAAFPDGPPPSWKVMLDPALKGRVSLNPGGKGFFPIAQVAGGGAIEDIPANMDACWQFLTLLRPQIRILEFNRKMTEYVRKGEIDVHCTVLTNVMEWKDQGYEVSWHVPEEGISVGDDALIVPSGLPESVSYWAKRYVTFAMERNVQQAWCSRLGLCPMHEGIGRPKRFLGDPSYPDTADDYSGALFLPNKTLEKYEHGLWRENFNQIFTK